MQTKTILAATFVVPLLLLACNRDEPSPSATAPSQEKQAQAPSSQDRMLESAPPAAGIPPSSGETPAPAAPKAGETAPSQPSEPKKEAY